MQKTKMIKVINQSITTLFHTYIDLLKKICIKTGVYNVFISFLGGRGVLWKINQNYKNIDLN